MTSSKQPNDDKPLTPAQARQKLQQGISDSYQGKKPLLSDDESAAIQQKFAQKQQEERMKQQIAMITKNKQAAEDFLKENGTKEGVKTTESGLQYKAISEGDGAVPCLPGQAE